MVVATHAHRAVAVPLGATLLKGDILQGTSLNALAAVDAGIGSAVFLVVGGHLAEAGVHQAALEPSRTAFGHFGETLLVLNLGKIFGQERVGGCNLALGVFVGVELEAGHTYISFGHLQADAGLEFPAFWLHRLAEDVLRQAAFVAAGAGEICVP